MKNVQEEKSEINLLQAEMKDILAINQELELSNVQFEEKIDVMSKNLNATLLELTRLSQTLQDLGRANYFFI
jgi:hypothetical protein